MGKDTRFHSITGAAEYNTRNARFRTTGSYTIDELAKFFKTDPEVLQIMRGDGLASYNGTDFLGVDLARYLIGKGRENEVRDLFRFRGDEFEGERLAPWLQGQRDRLYALRDDAAQELPASVQPSYRQAIGTPSEGDQKLVWTRMLTGIDVASQPRQASPRLDIEARLRQRHPSIEHSDVSIALGVLSDNGALQADPADNIYAVARKYLI